MTKDTKNAIELKLPLETAKLYARNDPKSPYAQTALAAHALMKAIEEARTSCPHCHPQLILDWIEHRAAEILESEFGIKP